MKGLGFRTSEGKGVKPIKIPEENVPAFVLAFASLGEPKYVGDVTESEGVLTAELVDRGTPIVKVSSETLFLGGKGMASSFLVPQAEWKRFQQVVSEQLTKLVF
jgi:hypothetical protein